MKGEVNKQSSLDKGSGGKGSRAIDGKAPRLPPPPHTAPTMLPVSYQRKDRADLCLFEQAGVDFSYGRRSVPGA